MIKPQDFEKLCDGCGLCCTELTKPYYSPEIRDFDRGDGVCKHLTKDNLCEIFSDRPIWCKAPELWKYRNTCDWEHWAFHSLLNCARLKFNARHKDECAEWEHGYLVFKKIGDENNAD